MQMDGERNERITRPIDTAPQRKLQVEKWEAFEKSAPQDPRKKTALCVSFGLGTQLLSAAGQGDAEDVRQLVAHGADPNTSNADGLTPLHQVCIDNRKDLAELLLGLGARIDAQDNEGWTPLHAAVSCGHVSVIYVLLKFHANLLAVNIDGDIPLDVAKENHGVHSNIYKLLHEEMNKHGIDNNAIQAAKQNWTNAFFSLVEEKCKLGPTAVSQKLLSDGATLLHFAACHDFIEAAERLVESGADVDARDDEGWTPLQAAVHWDQRAIAHFLVAVGADPNLSTRNGEVLVDLAETSGPDMSKFLESLVKEADDYRRDGGGSGDGSRGGSRCSDRGGVSGKVIAASNFTNASTSIANINEGGVQSSGLGDLLVVHALGEMEPTPVATPDSAVLSITTADSISSLAPQNATLIREIASAGNTTIASRNIVSSEPEIIPSVIESKGSGPHAPMHPTWESEAGSLSGNAPNPFIAITAQNSQEDTAAIAVHRTRLQRAGVSGRLPTRGTPLPPLVNPFQTTLQEYQPSPLAETEGSQSDEHHTSAIALSAASLSQGLAVSISSSREPSLLSQISYNPTSDEEAQRSVTVNAIADDPGVTLIAGPQVHKTNVVEEKSDHGKPHKDNGGQRSEHHVLSQKLIDESDCNSSSTLDKTRKDNSAAADQASRTMNKKTLPPLFSSHVSSSAPASYTNLLSNTNNNSSSSNSNSNSQSSSAVPSTALNSVSHAAAQLNSGDHTVKMRPSMLSRVQEAVLRFSHMRRPSYEAVDGARRRSSIIRTGTNEKLSISADDRKGEFRTIKSVHDAEGGESAKMVSGGSGDRESCKSNGCNKTLGGEGTAAPISNCMVATAGRQGSSSIASSVAAMAMKIEQRTTNQLRTSTAASNNFGTKQNTKAAIEGDHRPSPTSDSCSGTRPPSSSTAVDDGRYDHAGTTNHSDILSMVKPSCSPPPPSSASSTMHITDISRCIGGETIESHKSNNIKTTSQDTVTPSSTTPFFSFLSLSSSSSSTSGANPFSSHASALPSSSGFTAMTNKGSAHIAPLSTASGSSTTVIPPMPWLGVPPSPYSSSARLRQMPLSPSQRLARAKRARENRRTTMFDLDASAVELQKLSPERTSAVGRRAEDDGTTEDGRNEASASSRASSFFRSPPHVARNKEEGSKRDVLNLSNGNLVNSESDEEGTLHAPISHDNCAAILKSLQQLELRLDEMDHEWSLHRKQTRGAIQVIRGRVAALAAVHTSSTSDV